MKFNKLFNKIMKNRRLKGPSARRKLTFKKIIPTYGFKVRADIGETNRILTTTEITAIIEKSLKHNIAKTEISEICQIRDVVVEGLEAKEKT